MAALCEKLELAKPRKRKAVIPNPNERFVSLGEILAQRNREPSQGTVKASSAVESIAVASSEEEEDSGSEYAEPPPKRRRGRVNEVTVGFYDTD